MFFEEIIMAKKNKAAKMPVKKVEAKKVAKKAPVKAPSKKEKVMTKKAPAPVKKAAPAKKPVPSKVEKKKVVEKKPAKSLKDQVLKVAGKLASKVVPKSSKTPEKTKPVTKSEPKSQKLDTKADKASKSKQTASVSKKIDSKVKPSKGKSEEKSKGKSKKDEFFDEEEVLETKSKRSDEEDEFDEFEEDYKKAKAAKKTGKKAYEEEVEIDIFESKPSKKYSNQMLADLESRISDEIAELREHFNWKEIAQAIGSMDFFIDPKNDECIEKGCDNIRTTQSYCRLHYLRNWKTIQKKKEILQEGKLQEYIEELISKYPPKYIEALLSDLSDDKEFYRVLNELNITSDFDFEEDEFENAVDDDGDDDDIGIETISTTLRYEDE
jgi:hypothetical protein